MKIHAAGNSLVKLKDSVDLLTYYQIRAYYWRQKMKKLNPHYMRYQQAEQAYNDAMAEVDKITKSTPIADPATTKQK